VHIRHLKSIECACVSCGSYRTSGGRILLTIPTCSVTDQFHSFISVNVEIFSLAGYICNSGTLHMRQTHVLLDNNVTILHALM
jgi:hypothetical protein